MAKKSRKPKPDVDPVAQFRTALPQPLHATFDVALALLRAPVDGLTWRHELGRVLDALIENAGAGYGRRWVDRLAGALGLAPALVYQQVRFARRFSPEEAGHLEAAGLQWAKAVLLMGLPDPDRARLQEQALQRGWSLAELRLEIRRLRGGEGYRGGRPRKPPSSHGAAADVAQMTDLAARFLDVHAAAFADSRRLKEELLGLLAGPDGERVRRRLGRARGLLSRLVKAGRELRTLLARVRRLLE